MHTCTLITSEWNMLHYFNNIFTSYGEVKIESRSEMTHIVSTHLWCACCSIADRYIYVLRPTVSPANQTRNRLIIAMMANVTLATILSQWPCARILALIWLCKEVPWNSHSPIPIEPGEDKVQPRSAIHVCFKILLSLSALVLWFSRKRWGRPLQ